VAKKLGKNLSSPLTEAGLLMEDAEEAKKINILTLSVVTCSHLRAPSQLTPLS
jgi:hypothetical protein